MQKIMKISLKFGEIFQNFDKVSFFENDSSSGLVFALGPTRLRPGNRPAGGRDPTGTEKPSPRAKAPRLRGLSGDLAGLEYRCVFSDHF